MEPEFKKASKSATNGECVEVASLSAGAGFLVRDSKDAQGHVLKVTEDAWHVFIASVCSAPGR